MASNSKRNRPTRAHSASLRALDDVPRLVIVHGLETASGDPVLARVMGHARRPMLTALASFASLAGHQGDGGAG